MRALPFLCGYMFGLPHCKYLVELVLMADCVDCILGAEEDLLLGCFYECALIT